MREESVFEDLKAETFKGDAVLVFTTSGSDLECLYCYESGVFYKGTKADKVNFFAAVTDIMSEKLYELIGREKFIQFQNEFLLKAGDKR